MPQITPFSAIRYNPTRVKDLSLVVAPPYDIIPPKMQDDLYRAHPNNIVRLILNKIEDDDSPFNNRYTRSAQLFESWLRDDILVRDKKPAVYIYSQTYKDGTKRRIARVGFIALMELDMEGKKVLAHENTLAAPKVDRLDLIRMVKANLSPIFVLYDDKAHKILKVLNKFSSKNKPIEDILFDEVRHRVWAVDDERAIREIGRAMSKKDIFIADGHHRYEVARMYARERQDAKSMMAYFVEADEKMLTILPTHRVIKDIGPLSGEDATNKLKSAFFVEQASGLRGLIAKMHKKGHLFGMCYYGKYYLLRLKKNPKALDVDILHSLVFGEILGIDDSDQNMQYVKDPAEAAGLVDSKAFKLAFFLNPTKVSEVKRVARRGQRMPKKATYFYPKPLSGLVINKLD